MTDVCWFGWWWLDFRGDLRRACEIFAVPQGGTWVGFFFGVGLKDPRLVKTGSVFHIMAALFSPTHTNRIECPSTPTFHPNPKNFIVVILPLRWNRRGAPVFQKFFVTHSDCLVSIREQDVS